METIYRSVNKKPARYNDFHMNWPTSDKWRVSEVIVAI